MSTATRPRGRPPIEQGSRTIELGLSLTERDASAVIELAKREHVSAQEIIRRAVARFLTEKPPVAPRTSRAITTISRGRIGL